MKIVLISDTHNQHNKINLPAGDMLVHCGDATGKGTIEEVTKFLFWFGKQDYKYKIFIAGNHDFLFEKSPNLIYSMLATENYEYLWDTSVEIEGINFYGSPYQPWFHDWAFNLERGPEIAAKWAQIPDNTDFLITHGPPKGILDKTLDGDKVGCYDLLSRIKEVQPKVHAFGHIHEGYGQIQIGPTLYINASTCTREYKPTNKPIVIEI